ncbi:MAG: hypothetical protein RL336_1084, partial [Pseudomonadota bacterium]
MRKQLLGMLATVAITHSAMGDVLYAGTLIDGSGAKPRQNVTLFIEGNTIKAIESGFSDAGDDTLIDLRDYTVLPGLMDMHVHLDGEYDRASYLGRFTRNEADYA